MLHRPNILFTFCSCTCVPSRTSAFIGRVKVRLQDDIMLRLITEVFIPDFPHASGTGPLIMFSRTPTLYKHSHTQTRPGTPQNSRSHRVLSGSRQTEHRWATIAQTSHRNVLRLKIHIAGEAGHFLLLRQRNDSNIMYSRKTLCENCISMCIHELEMHRYFRWEVLIEYRLVIQF